MSNGIVYFSYDNGNNWVNSSCGLPEQIRIGLGGITTSRNFLGVATKDNGVYKFDFKSKTWENILTDKQIIEANIGAVSFIDSIIYVGTQFKGVFFTADNGKSWTNFNKGLINQTISAFVSLKIRFMRVLMMDFVRLIKPHKLGIGSTQQGFMARPLPVSLFLIETE